MEIELAITNYISSFERIKTISRELNDWVSVQEREINKANPDFGNVGDLNHFASLLNQAIEAKPTVLR